MITGLNHLTLAVSNAERSFQFYTQVLGLTPVAKWPTGAYLQAGDLWIALVQDQHVRPAKLPEYTHVAFTVSQQDFGTLCARITASGAERWQENWTEGASLYFTDPDGHKLEIHASDLAARLKSAREKPWDGLEFF
jgi:catechol 2,3-dioxygenase-like lactoylglutathione lyase family enzyme